MWLRNPNSGEKSVTMTLFVVGFLVSTLKLLTSGMVIANVHLGTFSGSDFAMAVGALGAIYAARKHSDNLTDKSE